MCTALPPAAAAMRLLLATSTATDFPSKSLRTTTTTTPNLNQSCLARRNSLSFSKPTWLCGHKRRDQEMDSWKAEEENVECMFGSNEDTGNQIPTQAQSIVEGSGTAVLSEFKPVPDVDYLQELLAIQQQGPRAIGFFGTRNMGFMHQELIEILSYALVITKNHIYTSGASGTNAAVIRGALRAEKPELLTVILPQSLQKQPPESQELLAKVQNVIEKPHNDHLPLIEASRSSGTNFDLMIDKASTRLTKYADFLDPLKQNNTTQILKLKDGLPSQANGSCIPINWSDVYSL